MGGNATLTASDLIADYIFSRSHHPPNPAETAEVGRGLADSLAVAIAGWASPEMLSARKAIQTSGSQAGDSKVWGAGNTRLAEVDAAFLNAAATHVLDYDDVASPMRGHPSAVLLPVLVATPESKHLSGDAIAAAYITGYNVMCALSEAVIDNHVSAGWHSTCTIGIIGATVAASQLLGLPHNRVKNAIGLSISQASGSRIQFGTDAKWLQVGFAASKALRCTRLGQVGLSSSPSAFDGGDGSFSGLYTGVSPEQILNGLGTLGREPSHFEQSGLDVKKYPMCYATQRAVDGILELTGGKAVESSQVEHVEVIGSVDAFMPLRRSKPTDGTEAKFSMSYAMAVALLDGEIKLTSFEDHNVHRTDIQTLMDRISVREDQSSAATPRWSKVIVTYTDGNKAEITVTDLSGSKNNPLTDAQLLTKIQDCLRVGGKRPALVSVDSLLEDWITRGANALVDHNDSPFY